MVSGAQQGQKVGQRGSAGPKRWSAGVSKAKKVVSGAQQDQKVGQQGSAGRRSWSPGVSRAQRGVEVGTRGS